jgi:hypothetical protein
MSQDTDLPALPECPLQASDMVMLRLKQWAKAYASTALAALRAKYERQVSEKAILLAERDLEIERLRLEFCPETLDDPELSASEFAQRENARLDLNGAKMKERAEALQSDLARMTAERDALRADAERYRYLKSASTLHSVHVIEKYGTAAMDRYIDDALAAIQRDSAQQEPKP